MVFCTWLLSCCWPQQQVDCANMVLRGDAFLFSTQGRIDFYPLRQIRPYVKCELTYFDSLAFWNRKMILIQVYRVDVF